MTSFLQLKAPFVELRTLLTETEPPQTEIINLAVGEPQHAQPAFVADALAEAVAAGGLGKISRNQRERLSATGASRLGQAPLRG